MLALAGPARLIAQIEGERGIAPVISTGDIEAGGIEVDAQGKNGQDARLNGWKAAYRLAWQQLHGPAIPDGQLESMVSAVVVEREAIGPHHYIARLGISFDRERAGPLLAGAQVSTVGHSAPMLVVPVLWSGGVAQVFEVRGAWQKAWAEFHTGASPIDYVRPNGGGGDSLLLTAGQVSRHSRSWWRNVLDQFGASDVLMPEARLERQWPGGPVTGHFTARYGPDSLLVTSFTLTAPNEEALPAMLHQAVVRMDQIYADALAQGLLRPDTSLSIGSGPVDPALAALIGAGQRAEAAEQAAAEAADAAAEAEIAAPAKPIAARPAAVEAPKAAAASYTVQFASPDARAVDQALGGVRGAPGVASVATTSIAIGGTSVMRVGFSGSAAELAAALRARGWQVSQSGSVLRIKR
ncbi:MAG: heavy-metal-associated domain-containing protein [Proteobacteria bacterium]|nr:heavy-metal-associated domain-containing protein [Pseudomonadota bacterium]